MYYGDTNLNLLFVLVDFHKFQQVFPRKEHLIFPMVNTTIANRSFIATLTYSVLLGRNTR